MRGKWCRLLDIWVESSYGALRVEGCRGRIIRRAMRKQLPFMAKASKSIKVIYRAELKHYGFTSS